MKTCLNCLLPLPSRKKFYCNAICKVEFSKKERRRVRKDFPKTGFCNKCGTKLPTHKHKFCSNECRLAAWRPDVKGSFNLDVQYIFYDVEEFLLKLKRQRWFADFRDCFTLVHYCVIIESSAENLHSMILDLIDWYKILKKEADKKCGVLTPI